MTCAVCDYKRRDEIDAAMKSKPQPGWKFLSREFNVSIPALMAHRGHLAIANVKAAIKKVGNTDRQRKHRGSAVAAISLDTIARRLSKLATVAEASGNSETAVRALTALQSTLEQIRENAPKADAQITVRYANLDAITNPIPNLICYLDALLTTLPPDDVALQAGRLLALLQGKGKEFDSDFSRDNPAVVQ